MFNDTTLDSLAFHFATKLVGALALAAIWFLWWERSARPYFQKKLADANAPRQTFPMFSLLLVIGISASYAYYLGMEPAFRTTTVVRSNVINERESEIARRESDIEAPTYTPPENKLYARTQEMTAANRKSNEEAKKAFSELPPVRSNNDGGAESVE